ncbi:pyridine nucleotide-disulfide oxidoreductase [Altererythrobacter xixiisoli]|uniref:Pyridine nucleotide-disulfide oxidoreductase n=1 Tax=Croceibacterium xixiisoli TaxID=1476466 RepID=A0A6I4TXI8_9SPHN|nr:FAD-dependent oxidoreductase [Croceibacterium xixiisoli]MXO99063.1 pyridine nucleotide-disulfide oxidoreductase [Croceibacterium xixiisoli]
MRHVAIIGSGPAGYYTAEAAQKAFGSDVQIDIFDRLPSPYGLIRSGVAPDHQPIKDVTHRYEDVALSDNVRFVGNVSIGSDVSIPELQDLYDAVILATGAPSDRPLDIPGHELANVFGSAAFVGWYNGHPQFAELAPDLSGKTAVIIGMGNVALDVARILAKAPEEFAGSDIVSHALDRLRQSKLERIVIIGRRGPHQIMMTPKELGELGHLQRATPVVHADDLPPADTDHALDPAHRKSLAHLRAFAETGDGDASKPVKVEFVFNAISTALIGEDGIEAIELERTQTVDDLAVGTGDVFRIPADLLISCIGYRSVPIAGVPFDEAAGHFANVDGRVAPGIYCVGWARRGPSGTIGTNRPDGYAIIDRLVEDIDAGVIGAADRRGRAGFDVLAQARGLDVVTFRDWKKIEEAEEHAARTGAPREKFVDVMDMIKARN